MNRTLRDLAERLGCHLFGDPNVCVSTVSSFQSATKESLVFVEDPEHLGAALASAAAAVIAKEFPSGQYSLGKCSKPILISAQPRLTFARAARLLCEPAGERVIHSTAIVHASAIIGKNVAIGAQAVVGERVRIGDETTVGAGAVIDDDAAIGAHCRIDANVTIYEGTRMGDRVVVQAGAVLGSEGFGYVRDAATGRYEQSPQIGRLIIEDDVEIGANATIDRGALDETRIKRGAKIDNLVHIGHNCQIGENVVIAAQTGLSGSVTIEDNVIMGGQVGIGDHARVESGAMLGGQCGILPKKVLRGSGVVFWGTPAKPVKEYLKELAFLSRSAKKNR
ncbi:MAG TPA: UDP-3-O-(3-hydroxymyristoyl)glucosamine N-acyltransferase [Terriglobales bacterium]|nr:UDP-3-O-(3-hydroxymyristoyl)glucosamine N-acyltransferase [Terriglobales bacterium]